MCHSLLSCRERNVRCCIFCKCQANSQCKKCKNLTDFNKVGVVHTNIESQRSDANCTTYLRWTFVDWWILCTALFTIKRLSKYGSLNVDVNTVIFHIKHVSVVILHTIQGHLGQEGFWFTSADNNNWCILGISTHQYPYLLEALYWN